MRGTNRVESFEYENLCRERCRVEVGSGYEFAIGVFISFENKGVAVRACHYV